MLAWALPRLNNWVPLRMDKWVLFCMNKRLLATRVRGSRWCLGRLGTGGRSGRHGIHRGRCACVDGLPYGSGPLLLSLLSTPGEETPQTKQSHTSKWDQRKHVITFKQPTRSIKGRCK